MKTLRIFFLVSISLMLISCDEEKDKNERAEIIMTQALDDSSGYSDAFSEEGNRYIPVPIVPEEKNKEMSIETEEKNPLQIRDELKEKLERHAPKPTVSVEVLEKLAEECKALSKKENQNYQPIIGQLVFNKIAKAVPRDGEEVVIQTYSIRIDSGSREFKISVHAPIKIAEEFEKELGIYAYIGQKNFDGNQVYGICAYDYKSPSNTYRGKLETFTELVEVAN